MKECDQCGRRRKCQKFVTRIGETEIDRYTLCRECFKKHVTLTIPTTPKPSEEK